MLNQPSSTNSQIAKVRYLESDFQVIVPGSHVICAVTDEIIPLDELKYWSWERQEAYVDAHASIEAEKLTGRLS